jgi:hypothetical protein
MPTPNVVVLILPTKIELSQAMFATKQKFKITGRVFLQMPIGSPSFPDTSGGTDVLAVIAAGTVLLRQPARAIKLSVSGRMSAAYGN